MPIFMKFGDIKGDVTRADYAGWIELTSVQLGQLRVTGARGRGADREVPPNPLQEIMVTKLPDSVSALLAQQATNPKPVEVLIDFVSDDPPERYLRITLAGCIISSYSLSGNDSHRTEALVLNFESITYQPTLHN